MKFTTIIFTFATSALAATIASNQGATNSSTQAASVSSAQDSELSSIINNANQIDSQSNGIQAMSKSNKARMIISNKVAQSGVPLGKYSGQFNVNSASNSNSCTEGTMFCDHYGNGFWTCAQGSYVYRDCGPGTTCKQQNGNLYCGYP